MNESGSKTQRILLAEDDACTAFLLTKTIQRAGYLVRHCTDGEAALAVLEKESFDAVVLDLMMPKVDGMQVLKGMRTMPGHMLTPVIILTAAKLKVVEEEALRFGAKRFLEKTQHDQLATVLREILEERAGVASIKLRMAPPSA